MKMSFVSPVLPASIAKRPIIRLHKGASCYNTQVHDGVDNAIDAPSCGSMRTSTRI
jgi:hypothetical protein